MYLKRLLNSKIFRVLVTFKSFLNKLYLNNFRMHKKIYYKNIIYLKC